jgi:copper chaperone
MATNTYTVAGMTCDHCVRALRSEVGGIQGVSAVDVDLATGTVVVTSETALNHQQLALAVEEAGYELAGAV